MVGGSHLLDENPKKKINASDQKHCNRNKNKNAFDGLVCRFHGWGQNLWAWGYLKRSFQSWKAKREKNLQNAEQNIQELWGNYKKCNRKPRKRRMSERNRRNLCNYNDWDFLQIHVRHQTADQGSSETLGKTLSREQEVKPQTRRTFFHKAYLTKGCYPKYTKDSSISTIRMVRRRTWTAPHPRRHAVSGQAYARVRNAVRHQWLQTE